MERDYIRIREEFNILVKERGFRSMRSFAKRCGIPASNIGLNLNGTNQIRLDRMFTFADTLGLPVDDVIRIFYKEEMELNEQAQRNQLNIAEQDATMLL